MPVLVSAEEMQDFLGGVDASGQVVLTPILESVEAAFVAACGRQGAPFAAAITGRVERHRGTGTSILHLDYPIATVTTVTLGYDVSEPDETLDPSDTDVLVWEAGKHVLQRVDGGRFGRFGEPGYVHVTYDTAADLPADAKEAIKRRTAEIFRRRGSEGSATESASGFNSSYGTDELLWAEAVAAHYRVPL